MLSKADVAAALVVMKRFWPYLEVDQIAVESWHAALAADIPDAETLREAILRVFRGGNSRDLGARIVEEARDILDVVEDPWAHLEDITTEMLDQSMREALDKAGVTPAEYEAHQTDIPWLRARFTQKEIGQ